jgi:hypothetical protein
LQVQIQSFVRQARQSGIEKDFVNLLHGKKVDQVAVKKLDNLINKILTSSILQSQKPDGPWSEFKYDNLTNQNIVEYEIPRETREQLKQQALQEAQNDQKKARDIYCNKFNSLRDSLISQVAQISTQPTIPPIKVPHVPNKDLDEIDERMKKASDAERLDIENEGLVNPFLDNGTKELIRTVQKERAKQVNVPLIKYDYQKMTIPENQEAVENFKRLNTLAGKFFSLGYNPEATSLEDNPLYRVIRGRYNKIALYKQENFHAVQQRLLNIHESNVKFNEEFKNLWDVTEDEYFERFPELAEEYKERVKRSDYASYFLTDKPQEH